MNPTKPIYFSRFYAKFTWKYFTTIRGKTFPKRKRLHEGDEVTIHIGSFVYTFAIIRKIAYKMIKDIPRVVLTYDVMPIPITTHEVFCDYLSKLARNRKIYRPKDTVSIILLENKRKSARPTPEAVSDWFRYLQSGFYDYYE